ncbi:MAG TPA: 1-acyl-sn-glycerol-3-phosphate acyltransferase, partial [Thermoanaerobaculia bacterium]|nr:1-acyl-sn-glycerol-3-phosphate acyltransferase [Thermoanaerobaculia bacterium]
MTHTVAVPLWLLVLLLALAAWAALERLLLPSVRWFLRSRANRVLEEVKHRFQIEIRPFQLTRRRVLIDRLVYDSQVVEAAQAFALEQNMPREVAMAKVERYAREIVPAFNAYFYFRLGYWVSRSLARVLYRVRIGFLDEPALQAVPREAAVVFVINHRSNMDYLLVAHLAASRTALSYAVGEWARIWPLESLLKAMGAYFVRRRSRNALYRRVLERYVQMATAAGVPQAMFPEGGLSRDGRLGAPKLGLLDYMVKSFDPQGPRDIVFVPVAVNYDRVLEDRTLLLDVPAATAPSAASSTAAAAATAAEPRRRPGKLGAVWNLLRFVSGQLWLVITGRWHRFGYACVSFGTPVSLQRWCAARNVDPRALEREERFARIEELARGLMERIGAVVPVVPVALVSTVLREQPERWFSPLELAAEA